MIGRREAPVSLARRRVGEFAHSHQGAFIMSLIILVLGFYLIYPVLLVLLQSFNVARDVLVGPRIWGLDNWRVAFLEPGLVRSLVNTFLVWGVTVAISFPVAVVIAWTLARTKIPFSHGLELLFWVSFMMPGISTTIGWIALLQEDWGTLNLLLMRLPFINEPPLNIFSFAGIVWAHVMGNGISFKVMLLTPAFRNMDATLEEAARIGGASTIRTMLRVTLPLMASPLILVFALQLLRIFQSFETEQLLGAPVGFFVYSTLIYDLIRSSNVPQYGQATVLASLTLIVIALIVPVQRWILHRRQYTTITGRFKPGLIDMGPWNYVALAMMLFLLALLTLAPVAILVVQSFMTEAGYFEISPPFTLDHWQDVLTDYAFLKALRTTVTLAFTAAFFSPLLFALLAYVLVRTRWPGRLTLDLIIWGSAAVPGILSGMGLLWLFLYTPGLAFLYGTIWALIIVVVIQGKTLGVNMSKAVFVQIGQDMEESARIAGAGWFRAFFSIWIPLLMPTLVLLGVMNFTYAASTTSSIILIASADTMTLSIMALELASPAIGLWEEASIVSIVIIVLTVGVALAARRFGLRFGVRHQ